ncbi:TPA: hypothetical protein DEF17_02100 [bacterium]|nr:MAG: hypothetical protein AUJ18_08350 [Candidatus Hydrogenedentes bacterium CG1_02_42_14]PIU48184.1 MAG: hypothetical protein COS94_03490 [Candidatus Hydrogenedentes bacterium CG07_land_8_20_14_0_80_42_17]HBW46709.1 hypothetical protein [bacterium]
MGLPSRQHFEFRLSLNISGIARRPSLPDGTRYRVEKALLRRAEALGLRVYSMRMDTARIQLDALLQPNMSRANIERALWGSINAILRKEMPHLVKRTGKKGANTPIGGFFF